MTPPTTPPTTPGTYLRRCREAASLTIADVAARLLTEPRWAEHVRIEQLALIERDVQPASFCTIVALSLVYPIDFDVLVALTKADPRVQPPAADAPATFDRWRDAKPLRAAYADDRRFDAAVIAWLGRRPVAATAASAAA